MKIEFEGRVYDYDLDELDVEQATKIEKHVGGTLLDWENGLLKASTPCLQALGWMILEGGDLGKPIAGMNFKVMRLAKAWADALDAEAKAQQERDEPDPTTPAGASTPGTPGSTRSATGLPGSPGPAPASGTASGPTG